MTCPSTCYGQTCDDLNDEYGLVNGLCDYYGINLKDDWNCNCYQCKCEIMFKTCDAYWMLYLYNANNVITSTMQYTWKDETNKFISSGEIQLFENPIILCKHLYTFMCYQLNISYNENSYEDNIHWEIRNEENENSGETMIAQGSNVGVYTMCDTCDGNVIQITSLVEEVETNNNISLYIYNCQNDIIFEMEFSNLSPMTQFVCVNNSQYMDIIVKNHNEVDEVIDNIYWDVIDYETKEMIASGNGDKYEYKTCLEYPIPSLNPTIQPNIKPTIKPTIIPQPIPTLVPSQVNMIQPANKPNDRSNAIKTGMISIAIMIFIVAIGIICLSWWRNGCKSISYLTKIEKEHLKRLARGGGGNNSTDDGSTCSDNTGKYRNIHTKWHDDTCDDFHKFQDCDYYSHDGNDCSFELRNVQHQNNNISTVVNPINQGGVFDGCFLEEGDDSDEEEQIQVDLQRRHETPSKSMTESEDGTDTVYVPLHEDSEHE